MFAIIEKMLRDKTERKQDWADFIISKSDVWQYINMAYLRRISESGRCIGVECVLIVCKSL